MNPETFHSFWNKRSKKPQSQIGYEIYFGKAITGGIGRADKEPV